MKYTKFSWPHLGKIVLLLVLAKFAVQSLAAQTDFQIMVNGSWAYVVDPDPSQDPNKNADKERRIVLVAPSHRTHAAYIFAGPNAAGKPLDAAGQPTAPLPTGLYYIDIPNRTFAGTPADDDLPPFIYPAPQRVDSKTIYNIIKGYNSKEPRLAISLPMPDYYTTYIGPYGFGLAESKVDSRHVTPSTPARDYTIWMVLHYQVTSDVSAVQKSEYKDSDAGNVTREPPFGAQYNAISIVMRASDTLSNLHCDSYSIISFTHSRILWGLHHYARFPEQAGLGGIQYRGNYHYECPEEATDPFKAQDSFEKALGCYPTTLKRIKSVKHSLAPESERKDGQNERGSQGSYEPRQSGNSGADCGNSEIPPAENAVLIRKAVNDLLFGIVSDSTNRDLDCLCELTKAQCKDSERLGRCPQDLSASQAADDVLRSIRAVVTANAAGSMDCSVGQMAINGAIQ